MTTPRYVFETPRQVPTDRATLDRIADEGIQRELAEANEEIDHRLEEEALEDYARTLEKAQRLARVVPFEPAPSPHF